MSSFFWSRCAPMPLTLPPAQNAVPAPVINSTPTSGFSPQSLIMLRSAGVKLSDRALRTCGRLSVMIATRSRITHKSSLVPVSISVVVMLNFPMCHRLRHCEEQSDEAIQLFFVRHGLLRGACHRARIRATRWLCAEHDRQLGGESP